MTYDVIGQRGGAISSGMLQAGSPYLFWVQSGTRVRVLSALGKTEVALFNVDNTSDENKPLSAEGRKVLARAIAAALTEGEALAQTSNYYEMFNGATAILSGGRAVGISIPVGQTGASSYITARIPFDAKALADLAGHTIRLITVSEVTDGFTDEHPVTGAVRVDHAGGGVDLSVGTLESSEVVDGFLRRTHLYDVTGTEAFIGQITQIAGGSVAGTVSHTIRHVSLTWQIASAPVGASQSAADLALARAQQEEARRVVGVATWAADGMKAPTSVAIGSSIQTALNDADGRGNALAYVQLASGTYAERSLDTDGAVVLAGRGAHRTTIDGSQSDGASSGDVAANSTIDGHRGTIDYRDFEAVMRNGRYAIHLDDHVANARVRLKRLRIAHLGNTAAGWVSQNAIGHGSWSGTELVIEDCQLQAPNAVLQFHNNAGSTGAGQQYPSLVEVRRSQLVATAVNRWCALVQPLGSGVQDHLVIENCALQGNIFVDCSQWLATTYQPANHAAEILITGAGNTPCAAQVSDFGEALRIDSATSGSGSTVEIAGSAAVLLFGSIIRGRDGDTGVAGYAYGDVDVNDTVLTGPSGTIKVSMGARLGNRIALGAAYLEVTIDGTLRTVTFNADYTASSNATILALINAALAGSGTATLYSPGDRVRPVMLDEEEALRNGSGTHIRWMAPLAWDGSRRNIRIMTDADSFGDFAGMCWEPEGIYPGEFGRVKRRGWITRQDLIAGGVENGAPAIAYGEWYVPFGTIGKVDANSAPSHYTDGILKVVRVDAGQPATWTALELRS